MNLSLQGITQDMKAQAWEGKITEDRQLEERENISLHFGQRA